MEDTNSITALTAEEARRLVDERLSGDVDNPGSLCLDGLTDLPEGVAEQLARHCGTLTLNGLPQLSSEAAALIAGSEGVEHWELNGLSEISNELAREICKHGNHGEFFGGGLLCLDGLCTLHEDVALLLAKYGGQLSLCGLTELSPELAKILAFHEGTLLLNGLINLPPLVAAALAKQEGILGLDGLATISSEVAEELARHEHKLSLNGLKAVSVELARKLAQCKSWLSLDGISDMTDAVADVFADMQSGLTLNGVAKISKDALVRLQANPDIQLPDGLSSS
jgi:hypothetical protein